MDFHVFLVYDLTSGQEHSKSRNHQASIQTKQACRSFVIPVGDRFCFPEVANTNQQLALIFEEILETLFPSSVFITMTIIGTEAAATRRALAREAWKVCLLSEPGGESFRGDRFYWSLISRC